MKILKNEKGFIVSVTAIIIAVILSITVLYFSNSIAPNITSSVNNYSSSQARWAAISGMEHAFYKLIFGLDDIAGVYPFHKGNIVIDTMTVNPIEGTLGITSTGTHGNSTRIFSLRALPIKADSTVLMGFEDDEGFMYDPYGLGPGPRWWGLSCAGELPNGILPIYVLTGADSCFFFGTKVQNNSNLIFSPVETNGGNYELLLSLAAGKDVEDVTDQSDFQTGDFLEFLVNGVLIERWEGLSAGGGNPMYPTVGVGTDSVGNPAGVLTPAFQDFHFNLTEIMGMPLDTMRLEIEGKTNNKLKYIGIEGISLMGLGGWSVETGSYIEI
ncbi:hypothetical protein ACFL5D_04125 [Candidatus Neomarinimicrobiota bacterium]